MSDVSESKKPSVSVVIPTYNRANLIGRSIRSVLNQTYADFELIVVDDCSTDNTKDVLMSFHDDRIRYVGLDRNSGTPATPTNVGIRHAVGRYIAVQDSDDEWLPRKLEKQVQVLENAPAIVGVVYTDMWRVAADGTRARWRSPRVMPQDGTVYPKALDYYLAGIGTQTIFARRECFDKVGLFNEAIPMFIDTEWLIRVSKHYSLYHIDEPLANYYTTPGSIVDDVAATIAARKFILREYLEDIQRDKGVLARHYFHIGHAMSDSGQTSQGRAYLLQAARTRPLSAKPLLFALLSLLGQRGYRKAIGFYGVITGLLSRR